MQKKASFMLSFTSRSCKDFKNPIALKTLNSKIIVKTVFDNNSVMWSPSSVDSIQIKKSIQNCFFENNVLI